LLNTLEGEQRTQVFFDFWTHKEAFLKGQGVGVFNLKTCEINQILTTDQMRISVIDPRTNLPWQIQTLALFDDYSASIAVQGDADYSLKINAL
jgi:phosphopantetheinyl transferase